MGVARAPRQISVALDTAAEGLVETGRHTAGVAAGSHVAHAHICYQTGNRALVALHVQSPLLPDQVVLYDASLSTAHSWGALRDLPSLEVAAQVAPRRAALPRRR